MENAQILSVPSGETKTSFVNARIKNVKDIETLLKALNNDVMHFDKETAMRITALYQATQIVKNRLLSTKKKES